MIYDAIIARLYPLLNADTAANLSFWTAAELYTWAAEAAERLAQFGLFVEREPIQVEADSAGYALPTRYLSAIFVSLDGAGIRPANVAELEALSSTWPTDTGAVSHYALDVNGLNTIRLYKIPTDGGTLHMVFHTWPSVALGGSHRAPNPIGDYLFYSVLAEARSKRGDAQALDIAKHANVRLKVFEALFTEYWGQAQ